LRKKNDNLFKDENSKTKSHLKDVTKNEGSEDHLTKQAKDIPIVDQS